MGEHVNDIINGDVDEQTGEWLGGGEGFPRTMMKGFYNSPQYSRKTRAIRKELAILINKTKFASPDKNENVIVNECRQAINIKYGRGWRE